MSAETVGSEAGPEGLLDEPTRSEADRATRRGKSVVREYAEAILVAILLAFVIRVFVVQAFKIPSGSMIPTLLIGDHILVSKLSYGIHWPNDCSVKMAFLPMTCYRSKSLVEFGEPERGDVIVFRYPEDEDKDFIKRIIGGPGDTLEIRDKVVLINGEPLDDREYTQRLDPGLIDGSINQRDNFGPVVVPEGSYFVMGDNRDQSLDSRFWGFVERDKILGEVDRIYWSWNNLESGIETVRWDRIGQLLTLPL